MLKKLVLLPQAQHDIQEALDWYFEQEPGLDDRFLSHLDDLFGIISRRPDRFPLRIERRFRRALMRRFPYVTYYRHDLAAVYVYAVFHCSLNPLRLKRRLN